MIRNYQAQRAVNFIVAMFLGVAFAFPIMRALAAGQYVGAGLLLAVAETVYFLSKLGTGT